MNAARRRFFVGQLPGIGGVTALAGPQADHVHVLRLKRGDAVVVFDAAGNEADAVLRDVDREQVSCEVTSETRSCAKHGPRIVLLLCMPKGPRLEAAIRMATELGVDEVRLCESERTVVHWSPARASSRLPRLQRIAEEAAQQSGRVGVPVVTAPAALDELLTDVAEGSVGWVFHVRAEERPPGIANDASVIWIAIGPEGGFSDSELDRFAERGFAELSLGDRILRVETAVSAALTLAVDRLRAGS